MNYLMFPVLDLIILLTSHNQWPSCVIKSTVKSWTDSAFLFFYYNGATEITCTSCFTFWNFLINFVCTDPNNAHEVIFWDNWYKLRPWLIICWRHLVYRLTGGFFSFSEFKGHPRRLTLRMNTWTKFKKFCHKFSVL